MDVRTGMQQISQRCRPQLLLTLYLLLLSVGCVPHTVRAAGAEATKDVDSSQQSTLGYLPPAPVECERYSDLYATIDADLSTWKPGGISRRLQAATIRKHTAKAHQKGIALAFFNGKAYVLMDTPLAGFGHHVSIWATYVRAMLDLEQQFGALDNSSGSSYSVNSNGGMHDSKTKGSSMNNNTGGLVDNAISASEMASTSASTNTESSSKAARKQLHQQDSIWPAELPLTAAASGTIHLAATSASLIPDVEFVVHSIDRPLVLLSQNRSNAPLFRFCKTPAFPDVLIPMFHYHTKGYAKLLAQVPQLNAAHPWSSKTPTAFARFTEYKRYMHILDPHTSKQGAGNTSICDVETDSTIACATRAHLQAWAATQPKTLVDLNQAGRLPMSEHARFKYLVHVDGQGLSSRLEQLLPLGSLVFREESGYVGHYHALLKPKVHYLPFWARGSGPEDLLEGMKWAEAHGAEAEQIAQAGQAFALQYLSVEARRCYWLTLLRRYAALLTYTPKLGPAWMPETSDASVGVVDGPANGKARRTRGGAPLPKWIPAQVFLETRVRHFERGGAYMMPFEP